MQWQVTQVLATVHMTGSDNQLKCWLLYIWQVNEVLEQALDEILSQGQSDHSRDDDDDMDRVNDGATMSDMEDAAREEDERADDGKVLIV